LKPDISGRETHRETDTGEFRDLTYGPGDRIETMTDNTGTTTYAYDEAGRFSGITYPSGASVMYTRDKLDRTTDVRVRPNADAAEIVTHYDYDPNGNLAQIIDPNQGVTGFSYDDADRLTQRVLPNGVVTSYGYDNRDRVLSVVHRNASNVVLASVVYERSASGEPTKITREDGTYTRVEYDEALRIKKESEFDANDVLVAETSYGYDLDGNRTSKTTLMGSETYSYAAGFKLTGITGTEGDETYTHDGGGRLVGVSRGGVNRTIDYDSMDHITKVTDGGIEVERYTFDGIGRRVGVTTGGTVKKFLIAPNLGDGYESPQAVTDASGGLIATFIYAGEHPIAKITPNGIEYFLTDSMGSVIGKADSSGASTAAIKYAAFGEVESAVGASSGIDPNIGAEPRFQGMTLDSTTGLYFVRARSYDARTGRFVSRDPADGAVERAETFHPYAFAHSNPRVWRDPLGLFDMVELQAAAVAAMNIAMRAAATLSPILNALRATTAAQQLASAFGAFNVGLRLIQAYRATQAIQATAEVCEVVEGGGLGVHEAFGGQTLARHVAQPISALANRLIVQPAISAASSFYNRTMAEWAISRIVAAEQANIAAWIQQGGTRLVLNGNLGVLVGYSLQRGAEVAEVAGVRIVLVRDAAMSIGYRILTAFPTP
jgi:RHS repeat-associated protein